MDDLDTPSTSFDEEESSNGSNKVVWLAMLVGVVGVILGVTGIYMAAQATQALKTFEAAAAEAPSASAEELAALQTEITTKIDDIEGRMGNMGGLIARLRREGGSAEVAQQIQEMHTQTQNAFDAVSTEVRANRTQINETTSKLEELARRVGSGAVVATRTSSSSSTSTAAPAVAAPDPVAPEGGSVHTVQPGENMSVIARKYSVTLTALMAANPTVEPRKMMPGDKIVIPPSQ